MVQLGLELHPDKTRIVYRKDVNRTGSAQHERFTFLGHADLVFHHRMCRRGSFRTATTWTSGHRPGPWLLSTGARAPCSISSARSRIGTPSSPTSAPAPRMSDRFSTSSRASLTPRPRLTTRLALPTQARRSSTGRRPVSSSTRATPSSTTSTTSSHERAGRQVSMGVNRPSQGAPPRARDRTCT